MNSRLWAGSSLALAVVLGAQTASAQDSDIPSEDEYEEIVVTVGTRAAPRSATASPVPVDAIDYDALADQGVGDMTDLLRTTVPSFHVSTNPSRDAAALLRPVNLRGLAPDHTLVLVNNKRRHRAAVIQWISNGASDGAQGPDISAIPAAAIERIEVLRDGAAAQYGSDAIAGVVNFVLKDDSEGGSLDIKYGAHTANAREDNMQVAGNIGMALGSTGFINASAEFNAAAPTDRSAPHPDAVAMRAVGTLVPTPAKPWGNAEIKRAGKTFVNMGLDLNDAMRGYAFGNYTSRDIETAFFYRSPQGRSGVYHSGGKILVGGGQPCKDKYDYDATPENIVMVRDLIYQDPTCFAFVEFLPEGFTPAFGAQMTDYAGIVGVEGSLDNGLLYDVSVSQGHNGIDFYIDDTVNASFGATTPRSFDIGEYLQSETNFNVDVSYPMDVGLASDLNVAAGFEWRNENFEIKTGERYSWATGPLGADGFAARSNGFGGFNPATAGSWDRANIAAYVDLEADMSDTWRAGGALRFEDFEDFGGVLNYKLTSIFQMNDLVALRGSVGSGFRAPTPGQQNANNLATVVDAATGVFREQGTVASTNPVALALGGQPLDAETSVNFTVGLVAQLDNGIDITVDWFAIHLDDRVALSENLTVDDALRMRLLASGVSEASDFNRVRYFTNDFDTQTTGIDAVASYGFDNDLGTTNLYVGINYTSTEVSDFAQASTASRSRAIAEGAPEMRFSAMATHLMDAWTLTARYNFYGGWYDSDDGADHDGYGYLDLVAQYEFDQSLSALIGVDNVLDTYPDEANRSPSSGRLYPRYSPAGYNGALVYGRIRYSF